MSRFKHLFLLLFAASVALGLSSCIKIYEKYWINADGSGTMELQMDLEKFAAMMGGFAEAMEDSSGGSNNEIDQMFEDLDNINALISLKDKGISNVVNLNDKDRKIIGYRFDFANIEALNHAMRIVKNDVGGTADQNSDVDVSSWNFITMSKKLFSRRDPKPDEPDSDATEAEKAEQQQNEDMAMQAFEDSEYTIEYFFKGKRVKKCSHKGGVISKDKSSVKISVDMMKLVNGDDSTDCDIKLK